MQALTAATTTGIPTALVLTIVVACAAIVITTILALVTQLTPVSTAC